MQKWRKELIDKVTWTVSDWSLAAKGTGECIPAHSSLGVVMIVPSMTPTANKIRKALTLKPSKLPPHLARRVKPTHFYSDERGYTLAPKFTWAAMGMQRPAHDTRFRPTSDTRTINRRYVNKNKLFSFQKAAVKALLECAYAVGGAIAVCPCGMGKTEIIAATAANAHVGTIYVLVPRLNIHKQGVLKMQQRVKGDEVKRLCGAHKEAKGATFVYCTLQMFNKLSQEEMDKIQLVIIDEVHHAPAEMIWRALARFNGIVIGLTATLRRSDGFEAIIPHLIGPIAITVKRPFMPVRVRELNFTPSPDDDITSNDWGGMNYLQACTELAALKSRNTAILQIAAAQLANVRARDPKGRVLVMLDRRRHVMDMAAAAGGFISERTWKRQAKMEKDLKTELPATVLPDRDDMPDWKGIKCGLYVGCVMTESEKEDTLANADIIWASLSMAREGLDADDIHCVVLASHSGDREQEAGRGLRLMNMPRIPMFVFISDAFCKPLSNTVRETRKYFKSEGWVIHVSVKLAEALKGVEEDTLQQTKALYTRGGHLIKEDEPKKKRGKKRDRDTEETLA